MNRSELEHIIRAAGDIANVTSVIIVGSQSILSQFPSISEFRLDSSGLDASSLAQIREILFRSVEADIMIPNSLEKTEMVEAALGELSSFHDTFGYYAQGVDPSTSRLPEGWENRLVEICNENTNGISGLCLEIHDLIISKLYAGRIKDIEFFEACVALGLMSIETLLERLAATLMTEERRRNVEMIIRRGYSE